MKNPLFDELCDVKIETSKCTKCGEIKPISDFAYGEFNKKGEKRYKNYCNSCENKDKKLVLNFKKTHPRPDNHTCDCCGKTEEEILKERNKDNFGGRVKKKTLWTCDHDHKTKTFRGWICYYCNNLAGASAEIPENLINAANYIIKNKCNQ
jgi:hypothetical protein